jgi:hypothetical protein
MTTIVRKLWPLGWRRDISRETGLYLTRWSLRRQYGDGDSHKNGGWRVYLHRFFSGDSELHNHPWHWSFSVVLWGSYEERCFDLRDAASDDPLDPDYETCGWRKTLTETRRVRWFNWIPRTRFHQITKLHPRFGIGPITLFVSGPPHGKSWGFWVPGRGVVPHLRRKRERDLLGSS